MSTIKNLGIFGLAMQELEREGIAQSTPNYELLMLDRALTIRRWLDNRERNIKVAQARYGI